MKTKNKQISSGGFHVAWLMPLEGLFAFTMLTVALKFKLGVVFMLALFLALLVLGYLINIIANNLPKVTHYFESWLKMMKLATHSVQKTPTLNPGAAILSKQKMTTVDKHSY